MTSQPARRGRASAAAIPGEQGAVVVVECGSVDLAAQDAELMAEDDDLEVLGAAGTKGETSQSDDEAVDDAGHSYSASAAFALVNHTAEYSAPQHRVAGEFRGDDGGCQYRQRHPILRGCGLVPGPDHVWIEGMGTGVFSEAEVTYSVLSNCHWERGR